MLRIIILLLLLPSLSYSQESKIVHTTIYSKFLNEPRELTIYLPKDFKLNKKYDVIYCTDGQFINESYKMKLDSIYNLGKIKKFVIIGINSNEKEIPDSKLQYRNYEYVEKNSKTKNQELSSRFKNHLNFFANEVGQVVEKQIKFKQKNKYFYGTSNGAGFGVSLSKYYPNLFKTYILYSVAGENYDNLSWNLEKHPYFIIRYGSKEFAPLVENALTLSKFLTNHNYQHTISEYTGNHKKEDWLAQFLLDIQLLK